MTTNLEVRIPDKPANFGVYVPNDVKDWGERMKDSLDDLAHVTMAVDNLAHGCGAVAIVFHTSDVKLDDPRGIYPWLEESKAFGFTVSKPKLAEIIRALQYAYENFDDAEVEEP